MALNIAYTIMARDKYSQIAKKMASATDGMKKSFGKAKIAAMQYGDAIERVKNKYQGLNDFADKAMWRMTLPIVAAGGAMVKYASDMEETMNKVDVSFGKSAKSVVDWAKTSTTNMGMARQTALDSAALYGDMATGMGISQEKAAEMAMSLTQLGADLSSFKNISSDMAQTALKSIFTGETESLKNLGIVMTQTNLEQFALSKGFKGNIKDMTEAQKVNLRLAFVMAKTKNAQGDFVRTQGGAANQTRIFQENLKELAVVFGTVILPYFTAAIKVVNSWLVAFQKISPAWQKFILVVLGLIATIGPLIKGLLALKLIFTVLSANPFIIAAALIAGGIYMIYKGVSGLIKIIPALIAKFKEMAANSKIFQAIGSAMKFAVNPGGAIVDFVTGDKKTKEIKQENKTSVNSNLSIDIRDKGNNVKSVNAQSDGSINLNNGRNMAGAY